MMGDSRWIILLLTIGARGILGSWIYEEDFDSYEAAEDIEESKQRLYEEFAHTYAPYLRFHKTEGDEGFCFPHNATEYYDHRVAGDWSRLCNEDYTSVANYEIPTYWHAMHCSEHLHIAYWNFYGYNHDCDCCSGERDAWWEFIVVKIRNYETDAHLSEVMFGQKKGWYSRAYSRYELYNETHPVAYVGRASHGFYHDDGGSNTCCYYEDSRNPGSANQHMMTWRNLVMMTTDGNGEAWMTDPNTDYWNGLEAPTFRKDWYLCNLVGCEGSFFWGCGTSGCAKSDIGDDPF